MSRSDNDRLEDIIRAGRRLAAIVACGHDAFDQDWTLRDAAARHVEIVVDAYTRLSPGTQERFGDVPVEEMTGMRVLLAHMYWREDPAVVWETIAFDIPGIVETATSEHQPPDHGSTVHDEDVTIPRWQTAATDAPAVDTPHTGSGFHAAAIPPPSESGGHSTPQPQPGRRSHGGLFQRLFRRASPTPSKNCGRPTADGTPCGHPRPANIGGTCAAGHKRPA